MDRTTVVFPPDLKRRAIQRAKKMGISFGEFVRESVHLRLRSGTGKSKSERDPFFADEAVYTGPCPPDLSERIDDYLYGEEA